MTNRDWLRLFSEEFPYLTLAETTDLSNIHFPIGGVWTVA